MPKEDAPQKEKGWRKYSKDELATIDVVRDEIWQSAYTGIAAGSVGGFALYQAAKLGHDRGFWKIASLNKNTALLSVLLGGAAGSFIAASTTGKNLSHNLAPVFKARPPPPPEPSIYEKALRAAEYRAHGEKVIDVEHEKDVLDRRQREQNRLYRRATMTNSLSGRGGLSDSHGGSWVTENLPADGSSNSRR